MKTFSDKIQTSNDNHGPRDLFPIIAIVMGVTIVFVLGIGFYECKKDNKGILLPSEASYKKVNTIDF